MFLAPWSRNRSHLKKTGAGAAWKKSQEQKPKPEPEQSKILAGCSALLEDEEILLLLLFLGDSKFLW